MRQFNGGEITDDALVKKTASLGFQNVIGAFHVVNGEPISVQFFVDERKRRGGIVITDELLRLKESVQFTNLPLETESRWRLVETAWKLSLHTALLSVPYDDASSLFFVRNELPAALYGRRRQSVLITGWWLVSLHRRHSVSPFRWEVVTMTIAICTMGQTIVLDPALSPDTTDFRALDADGGGVGY